jgi:hypothetical protein
MPIGFRQAEFRRCSQRGLPENPNQRLPGRILESQWID